MSPSVPEFGGFDLMVAATPATRHGGRGDTGGACYRRPLERLSGASSGVTTSAREEGDGPSPKCRIPRRLESRRSSRRSRTARTTRRSWAARTTRRSFLISSSWQPVPALWRRGNEPSRRPRWTGRSVPGAGGAWDPDRSVPAPSAPWVRPRPAVAGRGGRAP